MMLRRVGPLFAAAACTIAFSGCAGHRPAKMVRPLVPAADVFQQGSVSQASISITSMQWWRGFEDPVLAGLVEQALAGNLELRQLAARIDQASALRRQAGARLFPTIDATGSYERRLLDTHERPPNSRSSDDPDETTSLGGLLDWELDLWGRLLSARRARVFEARAAVHDWDGGRVLLSASVAETYFQALEHRQQLRLVHEQIQVNQTLLNLTKLRFGQGQSSIVDVLQQQEQLASTRARIPDLEARLKELELALSVLLGRAPRDWDEMEARVIGAPPALPETGVPSDLLSRRPDLLAARDRVVAVDYRVAEAIADRLPRISIGSAITATGNPDVTGAIGGAFASMAAPIFDAGLRQAEVDLRKARLREVLAEYSQAYLAAVQEVETALLREQKQRERVQLLEDQLATAQRLLSETRHRYSQGLTDYLPVLNAVVTVQSLERGLITARRALFSFRVALHRALGGPMEDVSAPAKYSGAGDALRSADVSTEQECARVGIVERGRPVRADIAAARTVTVR